MTRRGTVPDDHRREALVRRVTETLFPDDAGDAVEYLALPNRRDARVLAPTSSRRLAVATLRHSPRSADRHARRRQAAAVGALLTGCDRVLLPERIRLTTGEEDFRHHMRARLGTEVHLGIHITPEREPVVQLLNADARTVGFAKLAERGTARDLVYAETTALRTLAGVRLLHSRVPQVLYSGEWRGHAVLVREALAGWRRAAGPDITRLHRAMRELSGCLGVEDARLDSSEYARTLRSRLHEVARRECPDATALLTAASRLLDRYSTARLRFGSWHGDWTPWNTAIPADTVLLWRFERFACGVPVGFDALHYALHRDLVHGGTDPTAAVLSLLTDAPRLLRPFGVLPEHTRPTCLLYLVDIALRHLGERADGRSRPEPGSRLLPTLLRYFTADNDVVRA